MRLIITKHTVFICGSQFNPMAFYLSVSDCICRVEENYLRRLTPKSLKYLIAQSRRPFLQPLFSSKTNSLFLLGKIFWHGYCIFDVQMHEKMQTESQKLQFFGFLVQHTYSIDGKRYEINY